ncbi:Uma2 family endonuclease [Dolichospermum planctonicum CS-1226]|uniref:Uma2 family endonuclease n=2 Tax=Dolichospermum planctonicum TaxID=136072 RepID=A0ABT5AMC4_9CYAN|nr:Uma2 family endonuclease [Dolichospermum planctonicum]MDB9537545.1 Uma2 family endonuclease [Dolichospermum planctonicum CS-1226]
MMAQTNVKTNIYSTVMVNIPTTITLKISHEQFLDLALANRDLQLERNATGELIIMPPTGSYTGKRNFDIAGQLWFWNRQNKLGEAFDSSTGFHLPNGSDRSPDAAWIKQEKWDTLSLEQKESFAPICPDFVLELRSKTDSLEKLQSKMREYIENGASLGWLIDQKNQRVEIYRPGKDVEILEHPTSLSGEDILPGFILDLTELWK